LKLISRDALRLHQKETQHAGLDQFKCCDCDRWFLTQRGLDSHLGSYTKHRDRKVLLTTTCPTCEKEFATTGALKSHLMSTAHKNLPGAKCPGCDKQFRLLSALTAHLESGFCRSGINKQKLDAAIATYDTENVITRETFKPRMQGLITEITGHAEESLEVSALQSGIWTPTTSDGGVPLLTPDSSHRGSFSNGLETNSAGLSLALVSLSVDHKAEGKEFACPQCPRTFLSIHSLRAHMSSIAHEPKIYNCPVSLLAHLRGKRHKSRQFSTLSGLTMHLENEACKGGMAGFKLAVEFMRQKFKDLGFEAKWISMGIGASENSKQEN